MTLQKYKLKKGDMIAILAPSSGKAEKYPHVYKEGLFNLHNTLGLQIREFPTCGMTNNYLYKNPQTRAEDINAAFADKSINGIITCIGGDDSVRILPYLNKKIIRNNPKLFMGYSDTTVLNVFLRNLGLIPFHGPSVMAGLAQMQKLPPSFKNHLQKFLFEDFETYEYIPYKSYCDGYPDWNNQTSKDAINKLKKSTGWKWINGKKQIEGQLFGGCIEALEFIKGTPYWPKTDFWNNKVLFLETSEEKPSISQVKYMLRNYGTQGILNKISALLFGRPNFYSGTEKKQLDQIIKKVIIEEFGRKHLPIITNMDFGHTDPQLILPIGATVSINPSTRKIVLINAKA